MPTVHSRFVRRWVLPGVTGILLTACASAAASEATSPSGSAGPSTAVATPSPADPTPTASPRASASPEPAETFSATYTGTWTLTAYETENPYDEPEYQVGDAVPGTLTIECGGVAGYCNLSATHQGESWAVTSAEVVGDGQLRMVLEEPLSNCTGGQVRRLIREYTYSATAASGSDATVFEPRTCTDAVGTLWMIDETWTFEGTSG